MACAEDVVVDEHLRELGARLQGPARLKSELLTEARHGLLDAVEAYREDGVPPGEAQRRAVVEFGSPAQLLPSWQAELAVGALRGLSLRMLAIAGVGVVAGDLTWRGSSWSGGPRPPAGYLLLADSVDWIWMGALLLSVAGLLVVAASARSPRPGLAVAQRAVGIGLTGVVVLGMVAGCALFTWSLTLWDAALRWPPMLVGLAVAGGAYFSLTRAARNWLLAAARQPAAR
ncbi:permease prefix domain 1-containing protein [Micromonospora sp. WMMD1120]|uniref:permease prefix domain 1-containing protein n=1 Tax=Micromonospora sp. WMMD1120 TaxID=3016106 RepID=UPI002417B082|nr:permease prefix domain 1-containing protein [Micromonospora sp. WMMD1120]MDG4807830.1 permease prefix domain 1-containing protein [Micromonospora sp. WMMD1120]